MKEEKAVLHSADAVFRKTSWVDHAVILSYNHRHN